MSLEGSTSTATSSPAPRPPRNTIFDAYDELAALEPDRAAAADGLLHAARRAGDLLDLRLADVGTAAAAGARLGALGPGGPGEGREQRGRAAKAIGRLWLNAKSGASLSRPTGLADGLALKEQRYERAGGGPARFAPRGPILRHPSGSPVPRHRRRREFGRLTNGRQYNPGPDGELRPERHKTPFRARGRGPRRCNGRAPR